MFSTLFVVSALITLIVLLSGRSSTRVRIQPAAEAVPVTAVEQIIDDFSGGQGEMGPASASGAGTEDILSVQDLVLPKGVQGDSDQPYLLRPRLDRWREEQVNRYWIPLEDIALDLVRRENDRRIEKLFEDIP